MRASVEILLIICLPSIRSSEFIVDSPSCRIPDYDPYDPSIDGIPAKWPPFSCSSVPPLTTVTGNYIVDESANNTVRFSHTLHLHLHRLRYYNISRENLACCFKLITRDDSDQTWPDDGFKLSKCIDFNGHVMFKGSEEFIWVSCKEQKTGDQFSIEKPSYINMHAFIGNKRKAIQKVRTPNRGEKRLSVMIIGFDSISRLNLMRTMPKTVRYLSRNGWYDLKGFNKVGDNTFPNLMATFTGMNLDQIKEACLPLQYSPLDDCPIIWKNFAEHGYVTAYGEDQPIISSFNSIKKGFKAVPTDYYLRPFVLAAHKHMKLKEIGPMLRYQHRIACYGPTKVADHIFNYSLDFSNSFSTTPTFSLFWQNGFSHEHFNAPSTMDETVLMYFKRLAKSGTLNRTIILFMSDHGFRFDEIRQTFLGYLEERLPFIYFWVPESFKQAHPNKIDNLVRNSNRLISHYDVYMTFVDILGINATAPGCRKCHSLFDLVPWNRTCADAGILDHWCTCAEYSDIDVSSPLAIEMGKLVVNAINNLVIKYRQFIRMNSGCSYLRLNSLISVKKKTFSKKSHYPQMVVVVETYPGFGRFEATVLYSGKWRVMNDISRINRYGNQSVCMDNKEGRKYCYCVSNTSPKSVTYSITPIAVSITPKTPALIRRKNTSKRHSRKNTTRRVSRKHDPKRILQNSTNKSRNQNTTAKSFMQKNIPNKSRRRKKISKLFSKNTTSRPRNRKTQRRNNSLKQHKGKGARPS